MSSPSKAWFIVQTRPGYDNKVKANLERRIVSLHMEESIFQVVIVTREETTVKNGKPKRVLTKVFPDYVLVEMISTDATWHVVRKTPGVIGFVDAKMNASPQPLTPAEAEAMLHPKDPYHTAHLPDHLQIGQSVSITAGPFEGFTGTVDAILADQGQVRVLVPVFNRTAPVAVDFAQVAALV